MPESTLSRENRRLKKSEVKEYIENQGATLHKEYTEFFFEDYGTGFVKQDLVYELPDGDFIFVFDPKGNSIPGKGNYYKRDSFLRMLRWTKKVNDDYKNGRASSVDHWRFYSKRGNELFANQHEPLEIISRELALDISELTFSYESLGKMDKAIEKLPYGRVWETLYDALVYYVGEVIIKRVDGKWAGKGSNQGSDYPYVTIDNSDLHYMPINIVWQETNGLNPCNLRKATADEIRTNALWHPKNNKYHRNG